MQMQPWILSVLFIILVVADNPQVARLKEIEIETEIEGDRDRKKYRARGRIGNSQH